MEIDASQLQGLPSIYQAGLALLVGCVIGALTLLVYVGIRAACDAWTERRIEQLSRKTWFAEQERIHRETS
jgi:hypothetical protein